MDNDLGAPSDTATSSGQRDTERPLLAGDARVRALVAAMGQMVWTADATGVIQESEAWCAFTGQPEAPLTVARWLALIHPEDQTQARTCWRDAIAGKSIYMAEYRVRRHDGLYRWCVDRGVPLIAADGSVREWVGTFMDITEQREAQQQLHLLNAALEARVRQRTAALEATQELLHTAVTKAPILLFAIDPNGTYTLRVGGALDAAGVRPEDQVGTSVYCLDSQRPDRAHHFTRALAGDAHTSTIEISDRVFETHWQPIYDGRNAINGVMGVSVDITEPARARTAAEELARLRNDFVSAVSHELRTPLTAIIGYIELLQARWTQTSEAARLDQLGRIAMAAGRQRRLVEDLLLLSQLETGVLVPAPLATLLAPLVRQAAEEIQGSYACQQIDLEGPADVLVLVEPARAVQVLSNLIDNAAKYSPEGSPISITWQVEGAAAVVRVRDAGTGVPEHGRNRLFSRFGRIPGSQARAGRMGTGLGLYLSRQLAQAMDGALDLEATGADGSVFRLFLPRAS